MEAKSTDEKKKSLNVAMLENKEKSSSPNK